MTAPVVTAMALQKEVEKSEAFFREEQSYPAERNSVRRSQELFNGTENSRGVQPAGVTALRYGQGLPLGERNSF